MDLQPISLKEACAFVEQHHRHHAALKVGHICAIAVNNGTQVVGVVVIGRPTARHLWDGYTAEVRRLCVLEHQKNASSMLYAASWRAAKALGYRRLITYILGAEPGTSLKAAGWRLVGSRGGGNWSRPSRLRVNTHPLDQKQLWEVA